MRRKDLEIRDRELLSGMLDLAEILHLAIKNEPFPYIVPLNFGYQWEGDTLVFYFHCATNAELDKGERSERQLTVDQRVQSFRGSNPLSPTRTDVTHWLDGLWVISI